MAHLDEIIDGTKLVFIDTSAGSTCDFTEHLHDTKSYKDIDLNSLRQAYLGLASYVELLNKPNTLITSGVCKEFSALQRIFLRKKAYFKKYEGGAKSKQRTIFKKICNYSSQIASELEGRIPLPDDSRDEIVDLLTYLDKTVQLKKLNGHNGSCTDEQLVGAAIHTSLYKNTPAAILTRDMDLYKLLIGFSKIISYQDFAPENEKISLQLKKNPVSILWYDQNKTNLQLMIKVDGLAVHSRKLQLYLNSSGAPLSYDENEKAKRTISAYLTSICSSVELAGSQTSQPQNSQAAAAPLLASVSAQQ